VALLNIFAAAKGVKPNFTAVHESQNITYNFPENLIRKSAVSYASGV
jgi:hypothetical protein